MTRKPRPDGRQLDLFVAYLTDLPLRDQRDVMERPFFSLSKGRRTKPIEYQVGDVGVKVSAPADIGLATIYDADVLIWAASQINEAKEKGLQHSPRMAFQPYDLLKAIKRTTSGADYKRLRSALRRLTATTVETNIRAESGSKWTVFHWLERVEEEVDEKGRSQGMVIELPQWVYKNIVEGRVLAITPDYFAITSGLARWLYRVVRKHAGNQTAGWAFTLRQLYDKSGSTQRFSDFTRDLRRIAKADDLPEYHVELYQGERGDECLHAVRRTLLHASHPARTANLLQDVGKRRTRPRVE